VAVSVAASGLPEGAERLLYPDMGKHPPLRAIEQYLTFSPAVFLLGDIATICDAVSTLRGREGAQAPR
jgi:hypothetical protein